MNGRILSSLGALLFLASKSFCAEIPKAPVPVSPFIRVVYGYADTMLKIGRDKNGLFLSALDRNTLVPLTNRPAAPAGVRDRVGAKDGPLVGSNPYHDENLLRLLFTMTELSGKPHYRAAAEAELKWFVANDTEEFRPWVLWDRCFELAPETGKRVALNVAQQQNADDVFSHPRQAGFNVRALAAVYAKTKDEIFTRTIDGWCDRFTSKSSGDFTPSLAIDCDGAAHHVAEPLASKLRGIAAREDEMFCSLPHDVKRSGGFLTRVPEADGKSAGPPTQQWTAGTGAFTTAQVGIMCVSRYDNTGKTGYRDLILAAAAAYLESLPAANDDAWPATFGHAISLELAAWRHSANWKYLESARKLGEVAVEKFWGTNALPKASFRADHYETVTGADTLALALTELHLNILHITAVRCPPNTIDR